eukprot:403344044
MCATTHINLAKQQQYTFSSFNNKNHQSDNQESENSSSNDYKENVYEPIEPLNFKGEEKILIFQSKKNYMRQRHYKDLFTILAFTSACHILLKIDKSQYLKTFLWFQTFLTFQTLKDIFKFTLNKTLESIHLKSDGKTVVLVTHNYKEFEAQIKDLKQIRYEDYEEFSKVAQIIQNSLEIEGRIIQIGKLDDSDIFSLYKALFIIPEESSIKGYNDVVSAIFEGKEIKVNNDI